jgi:LmbE family N-acetylglucosaminyl deacetylase
MNDKRLLLAFAHPDDESFGMGGTIARYTDEGVQVDLICATTGEAGTVDADILEGYESVASLRLVELDCATQTLGIHRVYRFNYRDSGMAGSPDNQHPQALVQADIDELVGRVTAVIRQVQPQVVVTFDPNGGYGHPDHIAMHRATVAAFAAAGDPDRYAEQLAEGLEPYQPQRLYHTNIDRSLLRIEIAWMRLRGMDPTRVGKNNDVDLVAVARARYPIHVRVNIRRYVDAWDRASSCHSSQSRGIPALLPDWLRRLLFGWQAFTQIAPPRTTDRIEHGLFAGVILQPKTQIQRKDPTR